MDASVTMGHFLPLQAHSICILVWRTGGGGVHKTWTTGTKYLPPLKPSPSMS